ncbi:uncharacterized protein M421DRAFT_378051 [Didymella exigua CBS 183.55]|uniref:Uncharacterized protein n=1 Tax=Didymella exigua CBS 183.55 TaxID=1150837 RepID=A0A6A5RS67_9PLEO|nr:uncharacterized protein M421DRAFT_378051 [Didymella exigua CBS 183.55]KAF1930612.1 hypothetical protein M421DRAFT_378051 [Didymella exigua CBS 183.55]
MPLLLACAPAGLVDVNSEDRQGCSRAGVVCCSATSRRTASMSLSSYKLSLSLLSRLRRLAATISTLGHGLHEALASSSIKSISDNYALRKRQRLATACSVLAPPDNTPRTNSAAGGLKLFGGGPSLCRAFSSVHT